MIYLKLALVQMLMTIYSKWWRQLLAHGFAMYRRANRWPQLVRLSCAVNKTVVMTMVVGFHMILWAACHHDPHHHHHLVSQRNLWVLQGVINHRGFPLPGAIHMCCFGRCSIDKTEAPTSTIEVFVYYTKESTVSMTKTNCSWYIPIVARYKPWWTNINQPSSNKLFIKQHQPAFNQTSTNHCHINITNQC